MRHAISDAGTMGLLPKRMDKEETNKWVIHLARVLHKPASRCQSRVIPAAMRVGSLQFLLPNCPDRPMTPASGFMAWRHRFLERVQARLRLALKQCLCAIRRSPGGKAKPGWDRIVHERTRFGSTLSLIAAWRQRIEFFFPLSYSRLPWHEQTLSKYPLTSTGWGMDRRTTGLQAHCLSRILATSAAATRIPLQFQCVSSRQ